MAFVIIDPIPGTQIPGGFAVHDPIEGWIFTILGQHATKFGTREEAEEVIEKHYKDQKLIVEQVMW